MYVTARCSFDDVTHSLNRQHGVTEDGTGRGVPFVAHTLRGKGFDASEDGTGRGIPLAFDARQSDVPMYGNKTGPLDTDGHTIAVAVQESNQLGVAEYDTAGTVRADAPGTQPGGSLLRLGTGIRRLTPRECERLQGFPEIQRRVTIAVCGEHQKNDALAALRNLRSPEFVWTADGSGSMRYVPPAEAPSDTLRRDRDRLAALHVRCDCERMEVEIRSPERSLLSAVSAGPSESFPLPIGIDSFAHLAALTTSTLALAIETGRAGSRASGAASTPPWSGSGIVLVSGREITERAEGAAQAVATARRLSMSTTSDDSSIGPTCDSTLITLCCSVASAIASFIPGSTSSGSFFAFDLTTAQGWTLVEHRGKPAADGPRYEAIGNSMAVPVLAWIGRRLQLVESLNSASEAA
jgi:hypothetical protein